MNFKSALSIWVLLSITVFNAFSAEKHYELRVHNTVKNVTGVNVEHALAINDSIPAPTLRFKLGDEAVIKVINEMDTATTLHWHGLLVPWNQDGPQFSNTRIIEPNTTHTFRFPIKHTGTYWYHSHTNFQEQSGLYGAIVIEDETPTHEVDHDFVYVMSDWTNEIPKAVMYNLKRDGDWYAQKKGFVASIWRAWQEGKLFDYITDQMWDRMGTMDLSDVGYDAFLINGEVKPKFNGVNEINSILKDVKHGDKIRFRVINASASTYFYFNIGNLRKFKVISKDGMPVQPVEVNQLLVGIAETYDVIFEVPHMMKTFEAKAESQDILGHASLMFGMGDMEMVPMKMKPSPIGMDMDMSDGGDHGGGHGGGDDNDDDDDWDDDEIDTGMDHTGHDMNIGNDMEMDINMNSMSESINNDPGDDPMPMPPTMPPMGKINQLNYSMLKSVTPTVLDKNLIRAKAIDLVLAGDMDEYTWTINGKRFTEEKYIEIKENEVITFRFINKTMMHHPMHLHGHFFRFLNGQGDFAPLFHTIDVPPMMMGMPTPPVVIEFHANEPGIWFLHCHNLYHMKMGMARLVKYKNFEPSPEDQAALTKDQKKWGPLMTHDDDLFWNTKTTFSTNKTDLKLTMKKGNYELEAELELDENQIENLEGEVILKNIIDNWTRVGTGIMIEDQKVYAALMTSYRAKNDIVVSGYLRHDGKAIVRLNKSFQVSDRVSLNLTPEINYKDKVGAEVEALLNYQVTKRFSLNANATTSKNDGNTVGVGFSLSF